MSVPWAIFTSRSATDANAPANPAGLVNPSGTVYSTMFSGRNSGGFTLEVITSGTLTGTFTLWASNKQTPSEADDTDWVDITSDITVTNPAGAATKWAQSKTGDFYYRKRLKYVQGSGTGTIQAYVTVPKTASS